MIKAIKYLTLFIVSFFLNMNIVNASDNDYVIDFNSKGSISVTLKETEGTNAIEGAEISLYHVASVSTENNKLIYTYNNEFKMCEADLSDLTNESLTDEINKCITNSSVTGQSKITNKDGNVKFENLELGLYLVKQTNNVIGYSNIDPFMVSIPENIENKWVYDIKAEPKTDIIRLMDVIVEKKWDSLNGDKTPKYVTIELLKGNEVIDTITLNKDNNWTYTWIQIPESDEYSVKEKNVPIGYTDTYRQEGNKFIVTNTKTLVKTGQNTLIIGILAGLGLVSIIFGIVWDKRQKYE